MLEAKLNVEFNLLLFLIKVMIQDINERQSKWNLSQAIDKKEHNEIILYLCLSTNSTPHYYSSSFSSSYCHKIQNNQNEYDIKSS